MTRILGDLFVVTERVFMVGEGWKLCSCLSGISRLQLDFSVDIANLFWNAQDRFEGEMTVFG